MNTSTAGAHLGRIVERYLENRVLPETVVSEDGKSMALLDWLESLRFDRSEFSSHLASRMGMLTNDSWISEVAVSLRDRIAEKAAS